MIRNRNRRYASAAAAALLMGSASALAAIGEHEQQRTDPAETYEQQEGQHDTGMQESQRDTGMQEESMARQDDAQQDQQQRDQQMGAGQAGQQLEELAQQHGNLNTFIRAVQEAGMAEALTGTTEYTIFAPTDEAFEQADRSAEELLRPENREDLIALLRGHIVADNVDRQMAENIARTSGQAMTLDGRTVSLEMEQDQIRFGQATVVDQDIQQGNLRIYPVDQFATPVEELAAFEPERAQAGDETGAEDVQRDEPQGEESGLEEGAETGSGDDDWSTQQDSGDDW